MTHRVIRFRRAFIFLAALASAACATSQAPVSGGSAVQARQPQVAAPQPAGDFSERILAVHNRERLAVGAPPLQWDASLAASAAGYAAELARLGRLVHSPRQGRPGQGENLWSGTRGAYGPEQMVGNWIEEKRLLRPGIFPDVSTSGQWIDVSHYTQMIWRTTTQIGCALGQSNQRDFLVCRYSPRGNRDGQRVP